MLYRCLKIAYMCFFTKTTLKKSKSLFQCDDNNSIVRNFKFRLMYWSRIISLSLKVLQKLICEGYLFFLFIKLKELKSGQFFSLVSVICGKTAPSIMRLAWHLQELEVKGCSEPWKLSVFGYRIGLKLKKLEGFFPSWEYEELATKKSE